MSPSVLCSHPGLFFPSLYVFCCPSLSWSFGHHMPPAGWWAFPECCNFFLKECLEFFVWCRGGANMAPKAFGRTHHGLDALHMFFNGPCVPLVCSALNLNLTAFGEAPSLFFLKCTVARRSRSQNVNGAPKARVAAAHSSSSNELCQLSDCLLVISPSLGIHVDTAPFIL